MSYNTVLMEMVNEGPHHMGPFMLLIHATVHQWVKNHGHVLAVELGTSHGNSTVAMATAVAEGGGVLHTCDLVTSDIAQDAIYRSGCQHCVVFHKCDSVELAGSFIDNSVGILMIDTSDERDQTVAELVAWRPKMRRGGMIFLHDTMSNPKGVGVPALEFSVLHNWPYYNIAVDCGLGV